MTPDEHEILRLKMRLLAQKCLLDWLADVLRMKYGSLPAPERAALASQVSTLLSQRRQEFATLTLEGLHPAESDLRTALFQEAYDEISEEVESVLAAGLTDGEWVRFSKYQA
jgi:hypothetical protein